MQRRGYRVVLLLFLLAVVLIGGVWAARVGSRLGFPVLVGFVGIGLLLGPNVWDIAPQVSHKLAEDIGYVALILILFEGGLHTSFGRIRRALVPSISLATLGVLISSAVMTALAYWLLQIPFYTAALFGVAVSSTDAAAVFSMLGGKSLQRNLVDVLEVESGTNDPMTFFLTLTLIGWAAHGIGSPGHVALQMVGTFALQMGVGLVVGLAVGYAASWTNQNIKLDTGGLYPTMSLAFAFLAFAVAAALQGSGFLAVYVASVVIGNRRLEHRHSILRFHEGLAWTMQILMFVVLGLQISLHLLPPILLPGVGLAIGALFIARPAAVWLSTIGTGFTWKEKHFLSWAGLRGAVPIVLALTALLAPINTPYTLLGAVFFVVIASTLAQGLTVGWFADKLDLTDPSPSENLLELVAIARESACILPVEITEESRFVRHKMVDIPFPPNTLCYAVIRGERVIVPRGATTLRPDDHLLILSDREQIAKLTTLFANERVGSPEMLP